MMAHENSVSFKVFLQRSGTPENEVRRFGIDRDVVCSFAYLQEKLQVVFPSLSGKLFTVHWKDADGDSIVITSDDELIIALTEMQTDVRKLYVALRDSGPSQAPASPDRATTVHAGVTCDGCSRAVHGFRYKCLSCADYDLCATCEGEGKHAEHFMVRAPVPISWRPHFGRRFAHHVTKSARKMAEAGGEASAKRGPCAFEQDGAEPHPHCQMRGGPYHHGRHHRGHPHRGSHGVGGGGPSGGAGCAWLDNLASYLSEWSGQPSDAEPAASGKPSDADYLRSLGETVANLLDPFGIDVDVEVRTNVPEPAVAKPAETVASQAAKQSESAVNDVTGRIVTITLDDASVPAQPSTESHEAEGWTVLGRVDSPPTLTAQQDAAVNLAMEAIVEGALPTLVARVQVARSDVETAESALQVAREEFKKMCDGPNGSAAENAFSAAKQRHEQAVNNLALAARQLNLTVDARRGRMTAEQLVKMAQDYESLGKAHFVEHGRSEAQQERMAQSFAEVGQIAVAAAQDSYRAQQAAFGQQQPTFGQQQPTLGQQQPTLGQQQPTLGQQQPTLGQQQATPGQQQPAASGVGPAMGRDFRPMVQGALAALGLNQIYPNLGQIATPQRTAATRPHIAAAVDQMMVMGFSNEGGWLTQLLEAQNGDIQKALDVLQPVRK